ncbi:MAG: hypothetical protein AAGE01_03505 [Pseudomonadota bacterium]
MKQTRIAPRLLAAGLIPAVLAGCSVSTTRSDPQVRADLRSVQEQLEVMRREQSRQNEELRRALQQCVDERAASGS